MVVLSGINKTNQCTYFSWLYVHFALMLMLCDPGRANIIVYDGNVDVEEFPDIELSYTQPIRKNGIEGMLVAAYPLHACVNISKPPDINETINWFVLMSGNSCTFETKVINAKVAGYSLGIIYTYRGRVETSNAHGHYRHAWRTSILSHYATGFNSDISAVVVKTEHGIILKDNYLFNNSMRYKLVVLRNNSFNIMTFLLLFSIVAGLFLASMLAFTVVRFFQQSCTTNSRLSSQHLKQLQTTTFKKGDQYETCAICLEDYKDQDQLRILPCSHGYHMKCIDPWLINSRRICPVCKRKVVLAEESSSSTMGQNFGETAETTPLLQGRSFDSHSTSSCLNASTNADLPACNTFTSDTHTALGGAVHPERPHEGQYVLNVLQL